MAAMMLAFVTSCGIKQVELNYDKLEAQYVELTPYWEMIFDDTVDKNSSAAISFSKNYKAARDIINYYNQPGRDIGPGGFPKDAPSDEELLWDLRLRLKYASGYTNKMVNPE